MTMTVSAPLLGATLAAVLLVPPLPFYFGLASSPTLGTCAAALLVIATQIHQAGSVGEARTRVSGLAWAAFILAAVVAHSCIAGMYLSFDFGRAIFSTLPLVLVIAAGFELGRLVSTLEDFDIDRAVWGLTSLLLLIAVVPLSRFVPEPGLTLYKPVFPFSEPSLFALALIPLILYCCVRGRGMLRLLMVGLWFLAGLYLENLTLVASALAASVICFRSLIAVPAVTAVGVLAAAVVDVSYYVDRLDLFGGASNLSTLVYLQGWQLIPESLERSLGWGLGFQQLGTSGTDVSSSALIAAMVDDAVNLRDGSFMFSKLVSEFGLLGLLLGVMFCAAAFGSFKALRRAAQRDTVSRASVVLGHSWLLSFGFVMFFRGSGYFTTSTLLLVAALTALHGTTRSSWGWAMHRLPARARGKLRSAARAVLPVTEPR